MKREPREVAVITPSMCRQCQFCVLVSTASVALCLRGDCDNWGTLQPSIAPPPPDLEEA